MNRPQGTTACLLWTSSPARPGISNWSTLSCRLLVSYRQLDEALKKRLAKNKTRQMFVIYVTTKGEAPSGKVVK